MATKEAREILKQINEQRAAAPLSIVKAAEPLINSQPDAQPTTTQTQSQAHLNRSNERQSNASSIESEQNASKLTPAALSVDLTHYKDLFSKLRFSYLEQVTKEKYLKNTLGAPPVFATVEDNAALEEKLSIMKSELQSKKRAADTLVSEIEELAREVAERYETVNASVDELKTLPDEVDQLEKEVEELRRRLAEREGNMEIDDDPRMNLGMEETERLLQQQIAQNEAMQRQIREMERDLPAKVRESERAERELVDIETRRNEVTRLARDSQRLREEGGRNLLEEQGRWYQSTEVVLKGLLGVEA